jgi:hypothetical protein
MMIVSLSLRRSRCQRRREDASAGRSKNASRVQPISVTPNTAFEFRQ